ncbi:hypothetical protein JB92DRAFT_2946837, partial [Gautieria morchelliformis]
MHVIRMPRVSPACHVINASHATHVCFSLRYIQEMSSHCLPLILPQGERPSIQPPQRKLMTLSVAAL